MPAPRIMCDCGTMKEHANGTDLMMCPHCDHGCEARCTLCAAFAYAIKNRLGTP